MKAHKTPFERCLCAPLFLAFVNPSAANTRGEVPIGANLRDATLQGLNGPPRAFKLVSRQAAVDQRVGELVRTL